MKMGISEREWEEISAYLDDQLAPGEKTRLESALQSHAELQAALAELSRTRKLLREQPAIRAPHNFTLSPRFIETLRRQRLFSGLFQGMRLASLVASILFVLVFLGDLLIPTAGTGVPLAAVPVESISVEQAVQEAAPAVAEESVEATLVVEVEREAGAAMDASKASPDVGTALGLPMVNAQPFTTTEMTYPPPQEMPAAAEPAIEESMALEIQSEKLPEEGVKALEIPEEDVSSEPGGKDPTPGFWTLWRVIEVVLAIAGVTAGAIAIFLRITGRA